MTAQRALLVLAVAAGVVAGVLYYVGAQRVPVLVAAGDLLPGRAITELDVEMRSLPPDALPSGALSEPSTAVGRFPRAPIWKGQLVLAVGVSLAPAAFDTGIAIPTGHRAIAVPIEAGRAVGGAVIPGSRVDVIAVPAHGRASEGSQAELIAEAALVVDIRGEQGGPFERNPRPHGTAIRERLGSVVIAVGPDAEMWIAERIETSTFVIALVRDGS